MAYIVTNKDSPQEVDFWHDEPMRNDDGSVATDGDGNILLKRYVVRSGNGGGGVGSGNESEATEKLREEIFAALDEATAFFSEGAQ